MLYTLVASAAVAPISAADTEIKVAHARTDTTSDQKWIHPRIRGLGSCETGDAVEVSTVTGQVYGREAARSRM